MSTTVQLLNDVVPEPEVNLSGLFDVSGLFDGGKEWVHASYDVCKRKGIFPNMLAFRESYATLCVIVKRSNSGNDFALSEAGLNFLLTTLDAGKLNDLPVRHACVVLAEPNARTHQGLKVVSSFDAREIRAQLGNPYHGQWGAYWWLTADDAQSAADKIFM